MSNIECSLVENDGVTNVSLVGLRDEELVVDCSGDVDFTQLVTVLSDRIDTGETIEFRSPETDDEKTKLILETVKGIIGKFNESLTSEEEAEGDDIPF